MDILLDDRGKEVRIPKGFSFKKWSQVRNWQYGLLKCMVSMTMNMIHCGDLTVSERDHLYRIQLILKRTAEMWKGNNEASKAIHLFKSGCRPEV